MNKVEVLSNSVPNLFLLCKVFVRKFGALTLSRKDKEKKNVMAITVSVEHKAGPQDFLGERKKLATMNINNVILCSSWTKVYQNN